MSVFQIFFKKNMKYLRKKKVTMIMLLLFNNLSSKPTEMDSAI